MINVLDLTNQTQSFCKAFVADIEVKDKHNAIYSKMNLLGVFGFIIGPIIGGYLFDMEYGFYYISVVTFILAQISIGKLTRIAFNFNTIKFSSVSTVASK